MGGDTFRARCPACRPDETRSAAAHAAGPRGEGLRHYQPHGNPGLPRLRAPRDQSRNPAATPTATPATVHRHLLELEALGLVIANEPAGHRSGQSVNYFLNTDQAEELLTSLGRALLSEGPVDARD